MSHSVTHPVVKAETRSPAESGSKSAQARYLVSDLCSYLEDYLSPDQVREVYRAYLFGAEAHAGQTRMSGEPYIYHPVAVARILAGMRMDHQCLMAAILHDVIEDTETAKEQLAREFGPEIAELVDGVSKLTKINFSSRAEAQAENFRKMMLAMTRDIRVIMIKLADRLHNMRTLGVLRADKARRIAAETIEIYAPIAHRLGINNIRLELEDLGMAAYYPFRYRVLSERLRKMRGNRREVVSKIEIALKRRLLEEELKTEITGREKHLCSVYRKMRDKHLSLSELADVFAFRILVESIDDCYRVLGAVHNLYKPVPGRFKDYIAIPKANAYQSLHTVLIGPHGQPIEIQIRTREMHRVAEEGIAAHWHYKNSSDSGRFPDTAAEWVRTLLDLQKGAGTSIEFLEHVKMDLFPDEVYVFTPKGQIRVLAKYATVIDFAYNIHTEIGDHCVAARVDRQLAPLRTSLRNGQTVEIITAEDARPNPAWLDFVITPKARANIRGFLKHLKAEEAADLGRRMLDRQLGLHGVNLDELGQDEIDFMLSELDMDSLEELLADIGLGNRVATLVSRLLVFGNDDGDDDDHPGELGIKGTEAVVVNFAKCCGPIPGDPIMGMFSRGKGVMIHHQTCHNLGDFKKTGQDWLDVNWEPDVVGEYSTAIKIDSGNQRGMLATIAAAIAEQGSNIEEVSSDEKDGLNSSLRFVISVTDRKHLAAIMRHLRAIPSVMRISRDIQ